MLAAILSIITNTHVLAGVSGAVLAWATTHFVMVSTIETKVQAAVADAVAITKTPKTLLSEMETTISSKLNSTPVVVPPSIEKLIQDFTDAQAAVTAAAASIQAYKNTALATAANVASLITAHAVPAVAATPVVAAVAKA